MTSRPSSLLWTSTRRVARPPPKSQPRMATCKPFSAAASHLYGLMPYILLLSWLAQERTTSGAARKVPCTDKIALRRKQGTGIWAHDETTAIKYDLLLVCLAPERSCLSFRGCNLVTDVRRRADFSTFSPRRTQTTPQELPRATRSHRRNACVKATRRPSSPTFPRFASV